MMKNETKHYINIEVNYSSVSKNMTREEESQSLFWFGQQHMDSHQ